LNNWTHAAFNGIEPKIVCFFFRINNSSFSVNTLILISNKSIHKKRVHRDFYQIRSMLSIDSFSFNRHKALIRVDFNVPLNDHFEVTDSTRILAAVPTIKKVVETGGSVILMSHLGRPKGGFEDKFSLRHIVSTVEKLTGLKVKFAADCIGEVAETAASYAFMPASTASAAASAAAVAASTASSPA
jgi:hypothetical protein